MTCIDGELVQHAQKVLLTLRRKNLSVVTAESCTAGLIAAALSQAENASDHLQGGFITYTKANKTKALGVDPQLLADKGSVNAEVVCQLAAGALERSPADIALAVSGVLGPSEDEDGNPVGLIYLCTRRRGGEPKVVRRELSKDHHDVLRRQVIHIAFELICAAAD